MTQRQLAGDMMTASYVSLLESGSRVPTLDVVMHLARELGTTVEDLVGADGWSTAPGLPPIPQAASADPDPDPDSHPKLNHGFFDILQSAHESAEAGDLEAERDTLETAFRQARASGPDWLVVEIGLRLQATHARLGARDERLTLLGTLLAVESVASVPALRISLTIHYASALRDVGRLAEARASAIATLAHCESEVNGSAAHLRCLGVLISTLCELGDTGPVENLVTDLLAIAAQHAGNALPARAHWVSALAFRQLGRSKEALRHIEEAARLLASPVLPLADWVRFCRSYAVILLDEPDRLEDARQWLEDADRTAQAMSIPAELAAVTVLRGHFALRTGDEPAAVGFFRSVTGANTPLSGLDLMRARLSLADALSRTGQLAEAAELLRLTAYECERSGALQVAVEAWRRFDQLLR